jgi:hypothetical protein
MSKTLSLTNSKDLICNSLRIIHGDELLDVFELFLLKSEGADIVGISPESSNTLQEIANAIGNDAQFFSNIYTQLSTKANITDVYTKSYIDILSDDIFTKAQTTSLLSLKLYSNVITSYYNKTHIDGLFEDLYSQGQIDTFLNTKINATETYNKTVIDSMFVLKLNIAVKEFLGGTGS